METKGSCLCAPHTAVSASNVPLICVTESNPSSGRVGNRAVIFCSAINTLWNGLSGQVPFCQPPNPPLHPYAYIAGGVRISYRLFRKPDLKEAIYTFRVLVGYLTFWRRNYFFLILTHPVYKMWIIQEPNTLELWNKLHFEEKKTEIIHHV